MLILMCVKNNIMQFCAFLGRDCSETPRHICCPNEISETGPQQAATYRVSIIFFYFMVQNVKIRLTSPCFFHTSSSARPEPQTPSKLPYTESRPGEEDKLRRHMSEKTKRGYYTNTQQYQDTEL